MPARADVRTLRGWLRSAASRLAESGYESPRHDAERIAVHGLGVTWGKLWLGLDEAIDAGALDDLLEQRCSGVPLAYITGSTVFYGIELECGPGVLVPRPETETLVDVALGSIAERKAPIVVDVGTGTGAVAIAIAKRRPDAKVVATDVEWDAFRYAERNAKRSNVHIELKQGDLYAALPDVLRGHVDLIVSNPPYVSDDAEVACDVWQEPYEAVFAGPTGNEKLARLAEGADEWVALDGAVAFEVGTEQQAGWLANRLRGFGAAHVVCDMTDRPRVVWARR